MNKAYGNRKSNQYPNIVLHDATVTKLEINGQENEITMHFHHGFFVDPEFDQTVAERRYASGPAQIVFEGCDIDEIKVKEIRTQKLTDDAFFEVAHPLSLETLAANINQSKWKIQINDEYFSSGTALYTSFVYAANGETLECVLEIPYKTLWYQWDKLNHDCWLG